MVPVDGLTMADVPRLKQQVVSLMETKLREYNAEWIREDPH
jgi:hypothetical protein